MSCTVRFSAEDEKMFARLLQHKATQAARFSAPRADRRQTRIPVLGRGRVAGWRDLRMSRNLGHGPLHTFHRIVCIGTWPVGYCPRIRGRAGHYTKEIDIMKRLTGIVSAFFAMATVFSAPLVATAQDEEGEEAETTEAAEVEESGQAGEDDGDDEDDGNGDDNGDDGDDDGDDGDEDGDEDGDDGDDDGDDGDGDGDDGDGDDEDDGDEDDEDDTDD